MGFNVNGTRCRLLDRRRRVELAGFAASRAVQAAAAVLLMAVGSACGDDRPAPPADAGAPVPTERVVRVLRGSAVWYGPRWHGKRTASGERFDRHDLTAAHRSLPLGTRVRVTDLESWRQVIVRVNDRGPYGRDRSRIIDVSEAAARELGFVDRGSTRVWLEVLARRPPPWWPLVVLFDDAPTP
jgi:rare lipoprotein A